MFDQIAYDEKVARLNVTTARRLDALSAQETARHRRRMAKFSFLGDAVRGFWGVLARWHRALVLDREMAALSDHVLADIGVRRARIGTAVANGPARDPGPAAAPAAAEAIQARAANRPLTVVVPARDDKELAA